ncbi:hypothetical protein C2G38_2189697 [Gigaspora rosea]|uniref:BTB/POZ domain-containing protein n=1 Tax=Gigaspora rosea TaxID=44941 RepID=A0A397V3C1_9GLOM|nr:hypothetical protein C2G38_2189697 [Gigaspora rosea]
MAIKHFEKLSNNYIELLGKGEDFNVIIKVGKSTDIKEFKVHSAILKCGSSYFRNKLENIVKDVNGIIKIDLKSHILIQQFEIIIRYIYGGFISLESFDTQFIFDFILVADEFLLEELVDSLETYLIESKAHWLRTHFTHVYKTCFQNNKLKELQNWSNNILAKHPNIIFDSEDFNSLNETALVSLIKRDDLQMEEIKIWNYIVKWGMAQNPNLTSDPEEWPDENFTILKDTLKNCLPHIRYFQISSEDVANYHKVTSTILPPRNADEITSWIDKNATAYSIRNNPYEFKLLLRGSKDGFTRETFWNLCNKKANIVAVINVKGNDNIERIFGGYNPLGWDNSKTSWVRCHDSFVFSLKNSAIQNSILSRVKNLENATCNNPSMGLYFGYILGMFLNNYDGQVNGCYTNYFSERYEKYVCPSTTSQYYFVNEYEVFQIHKRTE